MMKNKVNIPSKWLITGGCGFIGTSLIRQLIRNDNVKEIIILDNLSVGKESDLKNVCDYEYLSLARKDGIFLKMGDIIDEGICIEVSKGVDCIVHLAANTGVPQSVMDPRKDLESNVIGTFNMLNAARINNVKQFIFASSGAPAGEVEPPIHEEIAPHPVSPYGASKLAGEGYCSSYSKTFGINTVALRFGNVYGPGSKHKSSVVAKFIKNVLDENVCEIYGDGLQTRDFIFIDDLVNAILKASIFEKGGELFQIASGKEMTINELVRIMENILLEFGYNMKIRNCEDRLGDVKRNYSITEKAKIYLDWQPMISHEEGLKRTLEYFIK